MIFVYGAFNKPVSAVESTVYITAIFKQHALRILHKYLPLYREADRRGMLAQVTQRAPLTHSLTHTGNRLENEHEPLQLIVCIDVCACVSATHQ